ncbi:hypothetical protein GCM10011365_10100 [Marinicella pacifica]|uniref:DUF1800 domain-containing protein n=1 Tax=Marinicella pacifica TaxID=1171543 RepID=A0A917FLE9_9GAMM|nr:DUF1800 domain-containing protein [Marinicella pacifica]GGF90914.1 hypothetical protein GCM10011365_10100 [Marinicella pacifica]
MKDYRQSRRQVMAGLSTAGLLTALPFSALPTATNQKSVPPKQQPTAGFKAAPLPNQTFAHMVLNRLGYGVTPGIMDKTYFQGLGTTDADRLSQFVDQQLAGGNDVYVNQRINQAGTYETLNKTLNQLWVDYHIDANNQTSSSQPVGEHMLLKFLRSTYSLFPLRERIAEFWHNHFSVYGYDYYARSVWSSWDRDVIRTHMLGNFKDFLIATARHPAMLYYLDNYNNSRSEPNENYGRELIELHTLGVENYYGLAQPHEVPTITVNESGGPWPANGVIQQYYVDNDVYETARCLTGWRVNDSTSLGDTGEFYYDSGRHDNFAKSVLTGGFQNFTANQGETDGFEVMEMLAYHPGTAKHIAGKLARAFISDNPPQQLIDDVATVFYDNRTAANQLELVFKALFNHAAFSDPQYWQSKVKRPFDVVVSAMRACDADFTLRPDDGDSNSFVYRMDDTGHFPYEWRPPDGYPTDSSFWLNSTALVHTWKTVDWLIDHDASSSPLLPIVPYVVQHFQGLPATELTPDNMVSYWMSRLFDQTPTNGWLGDPVYESIITFILTRPQDPRYPQWHRSNYIDMSMLANNEWPYYWGERLRGAVKLMIASPYFMQR